MSSSPFSLLLSLLLLLLHLLFISSSSSSSSSSIPSVDPSYTNQPIAPAYHNLEVSSTGTDFPTYAGQKSHPSRSTDKIPTGIGGKFLVGVNAGDGMSGSEKMKIAFGRGWCKTNVGCSALLQPELSWHNNGTNDSARIVPDCFSQFYVTAPSPGVFVKRTSLDTPTTDVFNFPHCTAPRLVDFSTYSMTYYARLFLIDLDLNATRVVGDDPRCQSMFPDLCYLQMWSQNIKNGFLCNNTDPLVNYRGSPVVPPCRSFCHMVLGETCPGFAPAVLRNAESVAQFCEVFPSTNCQSAAQMVKPDSLAVLGLFLISLAVKFLWW